MTILQIRIAYVTRDTRCHLVCFLMRICHSHLKLTITIPTTTIAPRTSLSIVSHKIKQHRHHQYPQEGIYKQLPACSVSALTRYLLTTIKIDSIPARLFHKKTRKGQAVPTISTKEIKYSNQKNHQHSRQVV